MSDSGKRHTPIELSKLQFRKMGYQLVDAISDFIDNASTSPVTRGSSPQELQKLLGTASLPESGTSPEVVLSKATDLLFSHSLFNGHPRFLGYITSSPSPIGALSDFLAAAVNPNVGANILSPMATEIEKQTVKWLAEFIGVDSSYGGLLVSGGNMANFTAFLAARTARAPKQMKSDGLYGVETKLIVYCSKATHTWVEKAVVLFGMGSKSIRWIPTDANQRMNNEILERVIQDDVKNNLKPMMIIGTAGDVSTGAVDDLKGIGILCQKYDLWFHIDGAYGMPAAILPELKDSFQGLELADSIALDPHKWLYSPLEAGCTLVKNPKHLTDTFSSHPEYYNFDHGKEGSSHNFYEYGFQNSRGFRALKVWMALQQAGKSGYRQMIREDISLSKFLFDLANEHPELEAVTQHLSIATLRYIPAGLSEELKQNQNYLNRLNETLVNELQQGGELFLSNAVVNGSYCLRGCIVNFRTSQRDIEEIISIIVREGERIHIQMQWILYILRSDQMIIR